MGGLDGDEMVVCGQIRPDWHYRGDRPKYNGIRRQTG